MRKLITTLAFIAALIGPMMTAAQESTANRFFEDAVARFNDGDFDGAIIQLKNALKDEPTLLPAMALLGEAYVETGNGAAAETALNEALEYGADLSLVAVPLARAFVLQFKHDQLLSQPMPQGLPLTTRAKLLEVKAQAALQVNDEQALEAILAQVDKVDPDSLSALAIKATVAMREGDFDRAQALVNRCVALGPDEAITWLTRASLFHARGESAKALADYSRVLELDSRNAAARLARIGLLLEAGKVRETDEDFEILAQESGIDPRLAYLRSLKLRMQGDDFGARSALADALSAIDGLGEAVVTRNMQLQLIAGVANYSLGNLEAARTYLEPYVDNAGNEPRTRMILASVYLELGEARSAVKLLEPVAGTDSAPPEVLALLARAYSRNGNHGRATAVLERATRLRPDDPALATHLAITRANRGQTTVALGQLTDLFAEEAYRRVAGRPLVVLYLQQGKVEKAAGVAARLLEAAPDNVEYLNLLGTAETAMGEYARARTRFEKALELDQDFTPARINLGKLERRQGRFAAAERIFNELIVERPEDALIMLELARTARDAGDRKAALRWARDAAAAEPRSFDVAKFLINEHLAGGDIEAARNVAWEQRNHHPNNLYVIEAQLRVLMAERDVEAMRPLLRRMADLARFDRDWLVRIGEYQADWGLLGDAEYTFFKVVNEAREDWYARARLADVHIRRGKLSEGLEAARALVDDFPARMEGHSLVGDAKMEMGEFGEAAVAFEAAFERSPTPKLALKRHLALRYAGDSAAAEAVLRSWLQTHPDETWSQAALAEQMMREKRFNEALALYEQVLAKTPEDAGTHNNLANIYLALDDAERALRAARRAYELAPENPLINDTLGWVLVTRGDAESGLAYLREARTRASTLPEIRYHLAVALHQQGRNDEALAELGSALEAGREFEGIDQATRLFERLGG